MVYRVIKVFADSQDNGRIYQVGEIFPRPDFAVSDARLSQLASSSNAIGVPLIEKRFQKPISETKKTSQIETKQDEQGVSLTESEAISNALKTPSKRGRKKKDDVNA